VSGGNFLFHWQRHLQQFAKSSINWLRGSEKGISSIEVLLGIVILGLVGVSFLGGIGTGTKATVITREQSIAESLVRSEAEYVKGCIYQYDASDYPVDPTLTIPVEWAVSTYVEPVHISDDGLQEVTVSAEHQGEAILSIVIYKVAR
jgi:type II secretory pathway pseudopilin PulG